MTHSRDESVEEMIARELAEQEELTDNLMRSPRESIADLLARIDHLRGFILSVGVVEYEPDASANALRSHIDLIRGGCSVAYAYSADMLHQRGGANAEWNALPFTGRRPSRPDLVLLEDG